MTLMERFENMERELGRVKRRNRWLLGALLLAAGILIIPRVFELAAVQARAQAEELPDQIRAKGFLLEDATGVPRLTLTMGKDGPALVLNDDKGEPRARFGLTNAGPSLLLINEKGKACLEISSLRSGPYLTLWDENEKTRARLSVLRDGPHLTLFDENGNDRFVAGKTAIKMPDGKTTEYAESSLLLFGPDGRVIWSAMK